VGTVAARSAAERNNLRRRVEELLCSDDKRLNAMQFSMMKLSFYFVVLDVVQLRKVAP
jgi:hypothetical protein